MLILDLVGLMGIEPVQLKLDQPNSAFHENDTRPIQESMISSRLPALRRLADLHHEFAQDQAHMTRYAVSCPQQHEIEKFKINIGSSMMNGVERYPHHRRCE